MTIRRDLAELEDRGTARRVRGGAVPVGPQPFATRHRTRTRAKTRIANKLSAFVPEAGAIAFDASSTVMRLATSIGTVRDLTVLTNGPDTFNALQGVAGVVPILTGGRLDASTGSLVGPVACQAASQIRVDRFITSAATVDLAAGAAEASLEESAVKQALAAGAGEVVLAVDHTKLGGRGLAVALGWDLIDVLVTDLDPEDARLTRYRDLARVV
jgi:DeoR family fructose operon transcriptional repressor